MAEATVAGLPVLPPDELERRMTVKVAGTGMLDIVVRRILRLHTAEEATGLTCRNDDCDACAYHDGHIEMVCKECLQSDEELWAHVLWPCPTVQQVADALRVYPDQGWPHGA